MLSMTFILIIVLMSVLRFTGIKAGQEQEFLDDGNGKRKGGVK